VDGRIKALSRVHAILSDARWQGAELARLVDEELAPYRSGSSARMHIEGMKLLLEPTTAQTLALALHELATNAAKYGALSQASGSLDLSWKVGPDAIVLTWRESGGPKVQPPSKLGFGTRIVINSIERQIGGKVVLEWRPEGLLCVLHIPRNEAANAEMKSPAHLPDREPMMALPGHRVMIVEDEALVAMVLEDQLADLGVSIVATCPTVSAAMLAIEEKAPDAAILDVNLGGQFVYPVADRLMERGIPFVFITGYGPESVDRRYSSVRVLEKPIERKALEQIFARAPEKLSRIGSPSQGVRL
jgi:CheY-like chemotaxis protein